MHKRYMFCTAFLFTAVLCCMPHLAGAYEPATVEFVRARVLQVSESLASGDLIGEGIHQEIQLHAITGPDEGKTISMTHTIIGGREDMKIAAEEVVILQRFLLEDGNVHYSLQEKYRLNGLMLVLGIFLLLGIGIGRTSTKWAKLIGESAAHVQDGIDWAVDMGFKS